ncbi:cytochrome c oxidase subunit II [Acidipila sp. EB88]|uniref:cytochrome c oxidase subunit II n=1 Tax=Acidipila sp. EB88 TaxID=2305226 RepID=UPI000F5DEF63|nr:cytochrome c oxidase subunit II [Acidipila sp. EB88]RRA48000.1 cytochrome c oxidase subunit II [Acidipila sp. EB88]
MLKCNLLPPLPALDARRLLLQRGMRSAALLCMSLLVAAVGWGENKPSPTPNMFAPTSTPAQQEYVMSLFVLAITGGILLVVGGIWAYVVWKFREKEPTETEPAQIYGSPQVELAWTIIPVILVVVLFLTTARMIFAIQDNPKPKNAIDVTVVGHQFWWEFRYPKYGVVIANELHVPMSTKERPQPTFMKLQSADVWHSFWVPQLAGKVDSIPDHVNEMWIDPHVPGLYVGQCGQFCGVEHAKMLLRVYVDTPDEFQRWITRQQQPAVEQQGDAQGSQSVPVNAGGLQPASFEQAQQASPQAVPAQAPGEASMNQVAVGKQVFQTNACMNCHAVQGTVANGRFGPDLTHFGSRETLGSGIVANNVSNLKAWIRNPSDLKEGALMPPMQLTETQLEQVSLYLTSLK